MNIAICDDEDIFRRHLRELLLKESFERNIDVRVQEYGCGEDLLAAYPEAGFHMDVVFLDIRMPGMDGLELARQLRQMDGKCLIIFLTSLPEYARKGYEVRAFRYLLKEEADRELGRVMQGCIRELAGEAWFSFSQGHCHYTIPRTEIFYFESRKRLVFLYTAAESYSFYQKLDAVETQLLGCGFLRCHRSFLVQERYVRGWKENTLWLEDGRQLPISRACEKEVNCRLMLRKG